MSVTDVIFKAYLDATGSATLTTAEMSQVLHKSHPAITRVALIKNVVNGEMTLRVTLNGRTGLTISPRRRTEYYVQDLDNGGYKKDDRVIH